MDKNTINTGCVQTLRILEEGHQVFEQIDNELLELLPLCNRRELSDRERQLLVVAAREAIRKSRALIGGLATPLFAMSLATAQFYVARTEERAGERTTTLTPIDDPEN